MEPTSVRGTKLPKGTMMPQSKHDLQEVARRFNETSDPFERMLLDAILESEDTPNER